MSKFNLYLCLFISLLTLLISCRGDDGQKIVILNPCIQTSVNNIQLNENVIVKSCSDGEVAFIRVNGIDNMLSEQSYVLNAKTDSLILKFPFKGTFEVRLSTSNLEAEEHSAWVSDTITVSE
jgi:hypothetical protein